MDWIIGDLKKNVELSENLSPPQRPLHNLIQKDYEDIAVEIEYQCFTANKVISLYRRCVVKQLSLIREKHGKSLFDILKTYVPKAKKSHGGDFKTIEADVKQRYGEDVLASIQEDQQIKKNEELKIKKDKLEKKMNANDPKQPKIKSFFEVSTPKINESEDQDSADLKSLEDIQANIRQQLTAMDVDEKIKERLEPPVISSEIPNYVKPIKVEQTSNGKRKLAVERVNAQKKSRWGLLDLPVVPEVSSKKSEVTVEENHHRKIETTSQPQLEEINYKSQEVQPKVKPKKRTEAKPTQFAEDKIKEKQKLCDLIIHNLNPFYNSKRFASKELFKKMARHLTKRFYKNYTTKAVVSHIAKIFASTLQIVKVEDFMTKTERKYYLEHLKDEDAED